MLTAEQIVENWNELLKVIDDNFTGDRHDKLKAMYEDLEEIVNLQFEYHGIE